MNKLDLIGRRVINNRKVMFRYFLLILIFFIVSCGGFTIITKTPIMNQLTIKDLGGKPLGNISPIFWGNASMVFIHVITREEIIAKDTPQIDWLSTTNALLTEGILMKAITGPEWNLKDPDFHREINKIVDSYSWTKEDYLLNSLKEHLTFPPNTKTSFEIASINNIKDNQFITGHRERYISFDFHIWMRGIRGKRWSEPKVKLYASAFSFVMNEKEAISRLYDDYYSSPFFEPTVTQTKSVLGLNSGNPINKFQDDWDEIKNRKPFHGMYVGSFFAETEFHNKSIWLANEGRFLEQQIKSLLQKIVTKANQEILGDTSNVNK